ncbi:protein-disulfide reductase DsbD [Pseudomaricurvus alcaniphilus]|uniref:protein-disulfide reductase DsbD family protein n=1 Tax=Pseudomaricurvus alcaniphilus TaxID=1166482 RepID=UPI001407777A|nr:protein-disulfide reductase DsbD [Pseudomaricurvus alcaniphilus]NHN38908.1 protein-disulfide reductase DsbD [Pseudomaricurvus alcaniphilus]
MLIKFLSLCKYYLLLPLLMVCSGSLAQFSDLEQSSNASTALSEPAPLSLQTVSFLPVEQAYRLNAELLAPDRLLLNWTIAEGYYLYQKQLKVVPTDSSQQLPLELPPGQEKYDDYFEEYLQVYYRQLQLQLPLPDHSGTETYRLAVHSQGCADAGLCYPPQVQMVEVSGGEARLVAAESPLPANNSVNSNTLTGTTPSGSSGQWLLAVAGALLGGLLLNLMPCVFPILSLKALSLANAHHQPHRQHLHGWAYTLGAMVFFVAIATVMIVLRQAGYAIGWGFQLQSPLVVAALAYVFFAMGLLFSSSYAIGSSLGGIGQKLTQGHSLPSSFFTGALACVVASPCTAPFMGSALGYAVTQPTPTALSIFAALGLGMALPFLLLSYYPSLSRIMPKPGQWMETFKQLLAFPLYLTALWLLWVLGRQAGSDAIILAGVGAVAIAFALWLLHRASERRWLRYAALAGLAVALLPLSYINSVPGGSSASLEDDWQPYSSARLEQLLASNTPVFVNLTADWCITCLANERVVLSSDSVNSAFSDSGIVKLKGDWTNYNPEITDLLARFDRSGVPLYLFYSAQPGMQPQVLPQILNKGIILDAISSTKNAAEGQVTAR